MQWPNIEQISEMSPLPEGYRFEHMNWSDIGPLIESIRQWFPEVSIGSASCFLTRQFYLDKVVFADRLDKDIIVLLIKKADDIAGLISWERENATLTLYCRLGVIAPAHRGAKIFSVTMELGEKIGRAMGVGFIYLLATMKMPYVQIALERAGYQLIGFMPGYDIEEISPGVIKRVFEAGYAKRLAPAGDFLRPEDKNMTPNTKGLFDVIFPRE